MEILQSVRDALKVESEALNELMGRVDGACERAVMLLHGCAGRTIVTGMGKAGLIGRKISATFSSVGIPSVFVHAGEATHGDLGIVGGDDVVIAVSNSGETREIVELLPHLKRLRTPIIALTGATGSTLARQSDAVIDVGVSREADPLGLAPTASTTAALAMGDALAAGVMALRRFTKEQYAQNHPGGSLGNLLLTRVGDLMVPRERTPIVSMRATMRDTIYEMTTRRLGSAFVIDETGRLIGIVTDGDLRRLLQRDPNPLELPVEHVMSRNPKHTRADVLAIDSMRLMEEHAITVLPVIDDDGKPVSAIHMHDLVKAGLSLWAAGEE